MLKSQVGLPEPQWPRGVNLPAEARKARHRLYPVSALYSGASLVVVSLVLRSGRSLGVAAAFVASGVVAWTLLEYLVHRYVLHGPFPDGPGLLQHLLHKRFDHLHLEHHQRPWDGEHINGSIGDTLPFVVVLGALAGLAPLNTLPMLLVGLVQSYVVEEWVHHSVHFYNFSSRYFRYIRRMHLYHHSRWGAQGAFGLTSDLWDSVYGTRPPRDLGARTGPPATV
jgi:dihydroceramide fatty acyl 2-hydroxylase